MKTSIIVPLLCAFLFSGCFIGKNTLFPDDKLVDVPIVSTINKPQDLFEQVDVLDYTEWDLLFQEDYPDYIMLVK